MSLFIKKPYNWLKRKGLRLRMNKGIFWFFYLFSLPELTSVYKEEVKEGMVVVDIGANIGYYSLVASQLVGKQGKVYAFEPERENFRLLQKTKHILKHKNMLLLQKAVSDTNGSLDLYYSKDNPSDHQTFDIGQDREKVSVEAVTLDNFIEGKVDFVKMDIQGWEWAALQGMQRIIDENKILTILLEFWPYGLRRAGADPEEMLDFFLDEGFEITVVEHGKRKAFDKEKLLQELHDLEKKGEYLGQVDLLCKR